MDLFVESIFKLFLIVERSRTEMMQKGYAGLSKKRIVDYETGPLKRKTESANVASHVESGRISSLHVVTVDRRASTRVQIPVFVPATREKGRFYGILKRGFDIVGASAAIIVFSPLIAGIVVCAYASSGSALFKHRRVGRGGRVFSCLKFRTMVPNADQVLQNLLNSNREIKEEWLRDHKLRDDPRVTRLGKFLRRTSLDELPQLWNVLRGEMSLVGPRPVVPDELRRYGNKITTFLSAPPGITGLWQVSGRNDMDYRRRVALDVCYVRSQSLLLDIYILGKTLPVVFARRGAY
jgi:lipopolysaccharide/colanic/teichoic acid biosynthesis glycosyltransferase